MTSKPITTTLGRLREEFLGYPDETPVYFGNGNLTFMRVKHRNHADPPLLQIEFEEIYQLVHSNT